MVGRHAGRVALVTGGASGIGRGIVERLVHDGARVVIADIDAERTKQLASDCGAAAMPVICDVRQEDQVRVAVQEAVDHYGALDIMVNNAGYVMRSSILETESESWRDIVDTNLTGVFFGTKIAASQMITQNNGGCIINASSGAGRHGVAQVSHYCATKAAVIMFSQSAAIEFAPHNIRVNCYTPGHIETPMMEKLLAKIAKNENISRDDAYDTFRKTVPLGRWGTPADVANAVSWYCTDDAAYITGQCFAMNGGELPW